MRIAFLVSLFTLAACGKEGEDVSLEAAFAREPASQCDELNAFAADVEAYVRAFEEMDPTWQPAVEELTQRRETILARAKDLSTHSWFAAPACKKRYAAVSERMASAGERARARREDLKVMSVDGKACLATCPKHDDEAARQCREGCKNR